MKKYSLELKSPLKTIINDDFVYIPIKSKNEDENFSNFFDIFDILCDHTWHRGADIIKQTLHLVSGENNRRRRICKLQNYPFHPGNPSSRFFTIFNFFSLSLPSLPLKTGLLSQEGVFTFLRVQKLIF